MITPSISSFFRRFIVFFPFLLLITETTGFTGGVFITMTMNPARMTAFQKILKPIGNLILSDEITGVIINFPCVFRNDPNSKQCDPATKSQLLEVFRTQYKNKIQIQDINPDLGPLSKLIPTVDTLRCLQDHLDCDSNLLNPDQLLKLRSKDEDTILLSLDDDQIYSELGLRTLIESKRLEKDAAQKYQLNLKETPETCPREGRIPVVSLGGNSVNFWMKDGRLNPVPFPDGIPSEPKMRNVQRGDWHSYVDLVEGWTAVAYSLDDIQPDSSDLMKGLATKLSKDCFLSDDLVISFVLGLKKIPKLRIHKHLLKANLDLDAAIENLRAQLVDPSSFDPIEVEWKSLKKTNEIKTKFGVITGSRRLQFLKLYQNTARKIQKLKLKKLGSLETYFFEELPPSSDVAIVNLRIFLDSLSSTELPHELKSEILELGTQQILIKNRVEFLEVGLKKSKETPETYEPIKHEHEDLLKRLFSTSRMLMQLIQKAESNAGPKVSLYFSEDLKPKSLTEADGLQNGGGFTEDEKRLRAQASDHGRVEQTKYQFCLKGLNQFTSNAPGQYLQPEAILEKLKLLPSFPWLAPAQDPRPRVNQPKSLEFFQLNK